MTIDYIKNNNLLLFECISGSKAYGLDTPESDTDIRGVFYLPKDKFYGLNYIEQVSGVKNDETYYELGRFVELLLKNNPNMLELLAVPEDCILYRHPIMDKLSVEMFLSKLCKDTFAGYAISQVKKARGLNKKIVNPMSKERKSVLDFCYVIPPESYSSIPLNDFLYNTGYNVSRCGLVSISHMRDTYALFYDNYSQYYLPDSNYRGIVSNENANDVCLSSIPKGHTPIAILYFNKDGYSVYCKEYKEYWDWVEKRNKVRYESTMNHGKGFDCKNMMHTIRLLQQSEEILTYGKLSVRVPNREELLAIRRGECEYDDLVEKAQSMINHIEILYNNSLLPDKPDADAVEKVLVEMRKELYN